MAGYRVENQLLSELWVNVFKHCGILQQKSCEMREAVAASKDRILKSKELLARLATGEH